MKLKNRLLRSILFGVFFVMAIISGFYHIRHQEQHGGTPKTLRRGFMLNESLWRALSSPKRLSVKKSKPNREPRVNGNLGLETPLDLKNYSVEIESGAKKFQLPVNAFKVFPKSEYATDFRCIEGWSEEMHYGGTRFSDFMKYYDIGKKPDGKYYAYVGLATPDQKYYVSIDMESMLHEQTVLAYQLNGRELSLENGAPIRLVIPIKYGIKSLKRIGRIFFSDTRPPDYWAERGYDWYSGL